MRYQENPHQDRGNIWKKTVQKRVPSDPVKGIPKHVTKFTLEQEKSISIDITHVLVFGFVKNSQERFSSNSTNAC